MFGPLLFEDDLSPEQKEELRERFESNPELADGWVHWQRARRQIRRRLRKNLPDRRLLVLYALEQDGEGDLLTPDEKEALDGVRDDVAEAIEAIPALNHVVERIQEERADFESIWNQHWGTDTAAAQQAETSRKERAPRRPSRSRDEGGVSRWTWRLAMAVLLIGTAVLAVLYGPERSSQTTVTVASGEQRVVSLGDGSTARIKGAAVLSYPSGMSPKDDRRITLKRGRAYFDVTPRSNASFVVKTPTATARVLGTKFGVTTGGDTTEVVLVEGQVRVGSAGGTGDNAVTLKPGQRSAVPRGQTPSSPAPVNVARRLDWTGLFIFRSVPVDTIAERLGQHYGVSISVAPSLADEEVTGTFEREQPVSEILNAVARTLGADLQAEKDTYQIEPGS